MLEPRLIAALEVFISGLRAAATGYSLVLSLGQEVPQAQRDTARTIAESTRTFLRVYADFAEPGWLKLSDAMMTMVRGYRVVAVEAREREERPFGTPER